MTRQTAFRFAGISPKLYASKGAPPQYFIVGMAPLTGMLSEADRAVMFQAMEQGMHIVNGLHEFLSDDQLFVQKALSCDVRIFDIRKPKKPKDLSLFSGRIFDVKCPKIAVLGTDTAIGKRTTATILTEALHKLGFNAVLVGTGQTSLIQGVRYGVAIDAIPAQFAAGEMEAAVVAAYENENPDILIIEGQGGSEPPGVLKLMLHHPRNMPRCHHPAARAQEKNAWGLSQVGDAHRRE